MGWQLLCPLSRYPKHPINIYRNGGHLPTKKLRVIFGTNLVPQRATQYLHFREKKSGNELAFIEIFWRIEVLDNPGLNISRTQMRGKSVQFFPLNLFRKSGKGRLFLEYHFRRFPLLHYSTISYDQGCPPGLRVTRTRKTRRVSGRNLPGPGEYLARPPGPGKYLARPPGPGK